VIERCTVRDCAITAGNWGGGAAHIQTSKPVFSRCVFFGNNGHRGGVLDGTGLHSWSLVNCLVFSNTTAGAASPRAGIYGGTVRIENCTIADNNSHSTHVAIESASNSTIRNTILWGNANDLAGGIATATGRVTYSCIENGNFSGTRGCVRKDPLFVDRTYYHLQSLAGDYRDGYFVGGMWSNSAAMSPLLNAGDPASDWSHEPDYPYGRIEMGAYGNTPVASRGAGKGLVIRLE
jgi:hypothetical protein